MRLGIVSDASHYLDEQRRPWTLAPLARQFEQWAELFDRVTVAAPLLPGPPPKGTAPYAAPNVDLAPLAPAGGNTVAAKLRLLRVLPSWWRAIGRLLRSVDAVHIRCPNNVGIPALLAAARADVHRQAVYTGTWLGYPGEPATYRWQRSYLARRFAGPVAVYGEWPDQPPHVVPSFSPSLSDADWEAERDSVAEKLERLHALAAAAAPLPAPLRLVTIGSLGKGQDVVIRAVRHALDQGVETELDVLGGGPQLDGLRALAASLGVEGRVRFHGHAPYADVRRHLREADFLVQAPSVEGYGKTPIEAFVHGAVPILSDVNLSAQLVGHGDRGRVFPQHDATAAAAAIVELGRAPSLVAAMIERGRSYARGLTLEQWREHIRAMLERQWNVRVARVSDAR